MNNVVNPLKQGERLPRVIPQWLKRRVEPDLYFLYEFGEQAGKSTHEGALVLDAGAGEGRYRPDFNHAKYVAVDLAIGDVEWDYSQLDAISDLVALPFIDGSFDAALCMQVLEHVPDPLRVLMEITRILKPGGKLYLTAPQSWAQHQKPYDFYRYTSYGLRYVMQKAGLDPVSIRPMGGYFLQLSYMFTNINFWLFPQGMRGRWLTWPIRAINGFVFQLMLPFVLYYLDPLDRIQDETVGYLCIASKPGLNK